MNRPFLRPTLGVLALLLLASAGCKNGPLAPRSNTIARMDAPRAKENKPLDPRRRDIVVEVTTDAQGEVVEVHFQRSSGKDSVDAYVAESIRSGWPHQPSTRSVASLSYSAEKGFTEPKILSSSPAL